MTFVGILAYKAWFIRSSWRSIYIVSTLLTTIFSLFQLLLVFQINTKYLHVPNAIFALGDDVVSAFLNGLQFLPVCIQYLRYGMEVDIKVDGEEDDDRMTSRTTQTLP